VSARSAAARRSASAPAIPRRVSGPVRRPVRVGGPVALPAPRTRTRSRVVPIADRLVRSRALIWLIGLALMGIVAMQVSLLKMNAGISRAVQSATTLERQNAALEGSIARLGSQERIRAAATSLGMLSPSAGSVGYLTARPQTDAARAARRMAPPRKEARAVLAAPPVPDTTTAPLADPQVSTVPGTP
jgi:cell division protein FtsL